MALKTVRVVAALILNQDKVLATHLPGAPQNS